MVIPMQPPPQPRRCSGGGSCGGSNLPILRARSAKNSTSNYPEEPVSSRRIMMAAAASSEANKAFPARDIVMGRSADCVQLSSENLCRLCEVLIALQKLVCTTQRPDLVARPP